MKTGFFCSFLLAIGCLLCLTPAAKADDGAASIAAGGLVSRRETRVVMAKEVLRISPSKVVADYDFRNDSGEDVTTEVAFPIPPYEEAEGERTIHAQSFSDFQLQVDGKSVRYLMEAKATLRGKDYTRILETYHIGIPSFGHVAELPDGDGESADLLKLSKMEQKRLIAMGLFLEKPFGRADPAWTVHLQYHWTQTFPAHKTVHIRHEYSPVVGYSEFFSSEIASALRGQPSPVEGQPKEEQLTSFCADTKTLHALENGLQREQDAIRNQANHPYVGISRNWVDFILTTANTWRQPIEDFTLIVERPLVSKGEQTIVSFCSPGQVEKLDADQFQVHLTDFVPKAELHIGFFAVPNSALP